MLRKLVLGLIVSGVLLAQAYGGPPVLWDGDYVKMIPPVGLKFGDTNETVILTTLTDPTAGLSAPVGSLALYKNSGSSTGTLYIKTGLLDTDWSAPTIVAGSFATSTAVVTNGSGQLTTLTGISATEVGFLDGVTSSLCGINQSCVVTNKSIDADSNTITNIDNNEIKASAAIDASKIADGTVSSSEFQFINSLTSNAQTQITARISSLTGDVTASGGGAAAATVALVGGATAANVATATALVNTAQSGNKVLASPANGTSAAPAFRALVGADLPNPSSSSLGGIQSIAAVAHKWINTISTLGVPSLSQPDFSDLTGTINVNQMPIVPNSLGGLSVSTVGSTGIGHWLSGVFTTSAVSLVNQLDTTGILPAAQGGYSVSMAGSTGVLHVNNGVAVATPVNLATETMGQLPLSSVAGSSVISVGATYTLTSSSNVVLVSGVGASYSVALPTAVGNNGLTYRIIRTDMTLANHVTVDPNGTQTIGAAGRQTFALTTRGESIDVVSDNANWQILSHTIPSGWLTFTPQFLNLGTVTGIAASWRREGDSLHARVYGVSGTPAAANSTISIPTGVAISAAGSTDGGYPVGILTAATNSGTPEFQAPNNAFAVISAYPGTSTGAVYQTFQGASALLKQANGNVVFSAGRGIGADFIVPIVGWEQ